MLKVLIVGCGNIAGGFDMQQPPTKCTEPYTHAGAFSNDPHFMLAACIEPNMEKRKLFMQYWQITEGFTDWDELSNTTHYDVISICTPTESHKEDIRQAISHRPKLIFCEKSLTPTVDETQYVIEQCDQANVLLAVNYTRRWDPDVLNLKNTMENTIHGSLRSVVALYNKGILNNGSHLIDLLHYLFGDLSLEKVGEPIIDYHQQDPSFPVWLQTKNNIPIFLACGHASDFALFELQFIFSNRVITMSNGGLIWSYRDTEVSKHFNHYHVLSSPKYRQGAYGVAMTAAVDNIYRAVTQGEVLLSRADNAMKAQLMCQRIKAMGLS